MMRFLENMFSKKKEAIRSRTTKTGTSLKKDTEKKQVATRAPTPQSNASIFGSLRRGQGGVATSTPRSTPTTSISNDVSKTKLKDKPPDKEKIPWFRSTNTILKREQIKPAALNGNNIQKSANSTDVKKRRPISVPAVSANVTVRRGQNQKIEGQNLPDNLSRTSSVTNLDVEQKVNNKGAKPRKSASRDRIDKIGEPKKNDKKGVTKNNNKLESGDSPYPSIDSLQEEEFLQLRRQLQEMAQEKSNLALQLGEQKGQLNILQKEIQKLKEESNLQLEHLTEENTVLRNRLRDVAHSPLSDNEKQQLLYESHRHHSSAPASIATNLADEGNGGDITACPTPDWDKHSSSNVSEVSVACLQDKINQMQETHYSTNEELQATLQELTDLQRQLTELQQENERLNEEKTLMFDSLCRQTERLNDSRSEVESLKQLLYREKDETGQYESAVEREQKLLDLLKSAQEEREALLVKLEQINNEIQETRAGILEKDERIMQLSDRVRTLESTLDAKHAEHKLLDQELAQAKDQCSARQIEINRLTDLLDNARTKITELEQDRALSDKSELDELLDNARKEKDALESEVAHLKEQLAISKNEIEKLKEQISVLQEECKVIRNNARTTQSDLEYKCDKLVKEKSTLNDQLQEFQEAVNELQVQSQCQLEDKRQLSAVLSETQRNLSEAEQKSLILENELQELKKLRAEENEEWEKFQNDLLTSVRVANDFKTEAQQELQRMILENKSYRERERQLRAEIDKLKGDGIKKGDFSGTDFSASKLSDKENVPNKEMDSLLKLSRKSRDKPRRSKDTTDTLSSGSKGDKGKEKKPDVLTKMVKRREKKPTPSKRTKTLSVEEELLLKSLNDWYENIDKNMPEDKLTEEEKVVRKLKTLYEDEGIKERPVAHKPKDQLAISKPLLDSVFLNPKLEKIARNPNVPTIEEIGKSEVVSYIHESPVLRRLPDRASRAKSDDFDPLGKDQRMSIISRSKSLDDLYTLDEKGEMTVLYRSNETEDLRNQIELKQVERESSILPSDSVSNPRYSDFAVLVNTEEVHKSTRKDPLNTKLTRKNSVNHETLETIVASIPKNVPESQLTGEQRFALRLKKALDEAERKNTLKKQRTNKKLVISSPLVESVTKNPILRDILLDPHIKSVNKRRNSETVPEEAPPPFSEAMRQSKSYQDISFTFKADPGRRTTSGGSNESTEDNHMSVTENVSSDDELNSETGSNRFKNIRNSLELPIISHVDEERDLKGTENQDFDSLTYNETLKKAQDVKKSKVPGNSEQHVKKILIVDVSRQARDNINVFNEDDPQDFDLLYNETLKKNRESIEQYAKNEPDTTDKIVRNKPSDQEIDLIYNETVNRKTESYVNKDKDLIPEPVGDGVNYDKAIRDLHNISKHQQLLEKKNNFGETIINDEGISNKIIDGSEDVTDIGGKGQELIYTETLNEKVKIPNIEIEVIDYEKANSQIEIAKEITILKNVDYHLKDVKMMSYDDKNTVQSLDMQLPELYDIHNKINDNFSKFHIDVSADIADNNASAEEKDEYNYQSILKENRVGVTSPLNIRLVYKDVVKEIKHKFPSDDDIQEDNEDEDENDGVERSDTFFDEFFGVKPKTEHTKNESSHDTTNTIDEIDKEMEEIFEKYLHTPLTKVITQIEEKGEEPDTSRKLENFKQNELDSNGEISKSCSIEDSSSVSKTEPVNVNDDVQDSLESVDFVLGHAEEPYQEYVKGNESEQDIRGLPNQEKVAADNDSNEQSLEEIMLIIDDTPGNLTQGNSDKTETDNDLTEIKDDNSLEVVSIFDENDDGLKKQTMEDSEALDDGTTQIENNIGVPDGMTSQVSENLSNDEILLPDKALSDDLYKEVVLTDKLEKLPDIVDSINKNVAYDNIDKDESRINEDNSNNRLTLEELKLLRSVRKERLSRPLSDFGEKDLLLIQEISTRYLPKYQTPPVHEKNVIDIKEDLEESTLSMPSGTRLSAAANLDDVKEFVNETQTEDIEEIADVSNRGDGVKDISQPDDGNSGKVQEKQKVEIDSRDKIGIPPAAGREKKGISKGSSEHESDLDVILARMIAPSRRHNKRKSIKNEQNNEEILKVNKRDEVESIDLQRETENSKGDVKKRELLSDDRHEVMDEKEENKPEINYQDSSKTLAEAHSSQTVSTENDGIGFSSEEEFDKKVEHCDMTNETNMENDKKQEISVDAGGVSASESLDEPDMLTEQRHSTFTVSERKSSHIDIFLAKPVVIDYSPMLSSVIKVDDVAPIKYWEQTIEDEISIDTRQPSINLETQSSVSIKIDAQDHASIEEKGNNFLILTPKRDISEASLIDNKLGEAVASRESITDIPEDDVNKIIPEIIEGDKSNKDLKKFIEPSNSETKDILLRSDVEKRNMDIRSRSVDSARIINLKERSGVRNVFMRDYKGVKDRLEYFSRNESPPPSDRQSLRTYSGRSGVDSRKVKSWAEHFEKRSLDTHSYEPVYANFSSLMSSRNAPIAKAKIEKKPLPVPRSKNQNSQLDITNYDIPESFVKNDTSLKELKMSDPENFSEEVAKDIIQEVAANVFQGVGCTENIEVRPDVSGNHEVPKSFLSARLVEDDDIYRIGQPIAIQKSEKFLDVPIEDDIKTAEDDGQINFAYGAESSYSTIAVAGKVEQLDITKHSNYDIEEMDTSNNQSKLNLFHIDTPSYDASYLSLFKQPEDKIYDDITGQKKPQRGYFNIAYLGEVSDNDSFDDLLRNKALNPNSGVPKSKPKIIDFVPLDDATKPVFKKNSVNVPDYDTLEREKTFQVLNAAPSKVKVRHFSKMESSKTSLSSGSSFSAAKKVFEALLEANAEKNTEKPKLSKKKESIYELTEKIEMGHSNSSVGLVNKGKMEENVEK